MGDFKSIFREYDIRGRVKKGEFDKENFRRLAKGFAVYLAKRGINRIVVGYDNRRSSPLFAEIAAEIFAERGFIVYYLDMCITPSAYFAQYHLDVKGLLMVTASHNPDGWCGCKLGDGFSKTLNSAEIKELYGYCADYSDCLNFADCSAEAERRGKIIHYDIRTPYIEDIAAKTKPPANNIRIVVDAGNGAAGIYAWELFQKLGYMTFQLNCDPDDSYPHYFPNPSEKAARQALKRSVCHFGIKADIGLAFDGDGDRLGVVDGGGRDVWADRILMILSDYLLQKHQGGVVVYDVKCSRALSEAVIAAGGKPLMWKTGHSYIKEKMKAANAVLAGERSGHIFIPNDGRFYDDALYAAAFLLKIMAECRQSLADILAAFPAYFTSSEIHIPCNDDDKYLIVALMQEYFIKNCGVENVCTINGARVNLPQFNGWALVRASSNLPELVVIAETKDKASLPQLIDFLHGVFIENDISGEWQNA